jgi:hypothetical protein
MKVAGHASSLCGSNDVGGSTNMDLIKRLQLVFSDDAYGVNHRLGSAKRHAEGIGLGHIAGKKLYPGWKGLLWGCAS